MVSQLTGWNRLLTNNTEVVNCRSPHIANSVIVVIGNPSAADGGTAFVPNNPLQYFLNLHCFVTTMVVTLPVDYFLARYGEGARLAKIISVTVLTLTAALFLFFFSFVLLVRSGVQH